MRCNTTIMGRNGQPDARVLFYMMFALYSYWSDCLSLCVDAAIESTMVGAGQTHQPQHQHQHQQSPYHNSVPTQQAHQFDGVPPRLAAVDGAAHATGPSATAGQQQFGGHSSSSSGSSRHSIRSSSHSAGDSLSASSDGIVRHLVFEPSQLDFHELSMGSANTETVTVFNRHPNRTVSIGPIGRGLPEFYSTFFDDQIKVIEPLSNTSFNVVFLPRQLGPVSSELHVQSTFGVRRFEMLGTATECPFRVQPLVGIRTTLNATLLPEIVMYNPFAVPLQVLEVYSSGGLFQLQLPGTGSSGGGGTEAPRHMWEIAPHSERPVVRVSFRATAAGNYSAYLRIMVVDESARVDDMEVVLPMQFEVTDQLGLYAEQPFLHFGRAGRRDKPKRVLINLSESASHDYRSLAPSIQSYAVEGDAALIEAITLRVHGGRMEPTKASAAAADELNVGGFRLLPPPLQEDESLPVSVDESEPDTMDTRHTRVISAELDWAKLTAYQIYRGHIAIRTLLSNNQEADLRIALVAVALDGAMFYNESHTKFVTTKADGVPASADLRSRDFVVRNDFTVPLVINNVSLGAASARSFQTSGFERQVLAAGQEATLFRIKPLLAAVRQPTVAHMRLHTNASTYEIRLASYNGLLRRIVPVDERTAGGIGSDELAISYGTLPLSTVTDTTVAFVNDNPLPVTIHNWTATISEAASIFVILRGCSQLSMDSLKFCYSVQPGEWIVFQVSVMSNTVGRFIGRLTLHTDYEELVTPVRFNTAVGQLNIAATETDERQCFPGGVCSLNLTAHSSFVQPITVREILVNVTGITYDYSHARQPTPIAPNRLTHIARLHFRPRSICGDECYVQLPDRWAPSVISHNCKHQLPDLMHAKLAEFRRIRDAFAALSIRVQTNQVRRYDFNGSTSIVWPKLVTMPGSRSGSRGTSSGSSSGASAVTISSGVGSGSDGDADSGAGSGADADDVASGNEMDGEFERRGPIEFPTFQVGEEVMRMVEVTNPSDRPIVVHLMLHDMVRHGSAMSLPPEVMSWCWDCFLSREQVFALVDTATVRPSELLVIAPRSSVHVTVRFSTQNAGTYSNLLYVRNNFTILEAVWLTAKAAAHQFKFGNRKPGSDTPLVFELTDKHFRDCDRGQRGPERKSSAPLGELANAFAEGISGISVGDETDEEEDDEQPVRVVAKRTFTAKNTGDIPIDIFGMYIEGIKCTAYGFRVMNCWNFRLPPDTTKKIEITFTPDFTLARVSRVLSIETSLNYPINYTLLSLVPAQALNTCGKAIDRPTWEYTMQMVAFVGLGMLLLLVLCLAFFDADRLLKEHAYNVSRDRGPTEPTLNLREVGLRNPYVEESIALAVAAVDGSAADDDGDAVCTGGVQKQLAALASNGHGNGGGGGGSNRSLRKRNSKRTESYEQQQQQQQQQLHQKQPPIVEAKSWVHVLVHKVSPLKTDVKFREPTPPPPPPKKEASSGGKRNVVAMMDANLPVPSRPDEDSSNVSTSNSTPSSNGGKTSSSGTTNKKGAAYVPPSSANSNKRHLNMPPEVSSSSKSSVATVAPLSISKSSLATSSSSKSTVAPTVSSSKPSLAPTATASISKPSLAPTASSSKPSLAPTVTASSSKSSLAPTAATSSSKSSIVAALPSNSNMCKSSVLCISKPPVLATVPSTNNKTPANTSSSSKSSVATSTSTTSTAANAVPTAANNNTVASNVPAAPAISKTKSKALVKKTKSCPLQSPPAPPSVAAVVASPASSVNTSHSAKVGKHHTPTEPTTTPPDHVKLDGRSAAGASPTAAGASVAAAAAADTRKTNNHTGQRAESSASGHNHNVASMPAAPAAAPAPQNSVKPSASIQNPTDASTPVAAAASTPAVSSSAPQSDNRHHNHIVASAPAPAVAAAPSTQNSTKSSASNHNPFAKPSAAVQPTQHVIKPLASNHTGTSTPAAAAATNHKELKPSSSLPTINIAEANTSIKSSSSAPVASGPLVAPPVAPEPAAALPDASQCLLPFDAYEPEKSPTAANKKYGKTPGRERRKDAPQPITRKLNLANALAGDHKSSASALFFKGNAFQFNMQQQPEPQQPPQPEQQLPPFASFAPPVSAAMPNPSASASSSVWDMNKATFSNVVAQSTAVAQPPAAQPATATVKLSQSGSAAPVPAGQCTGAIAKTCTMPTRPNDDYAGGASTSFGGLSDVALSDNSLNVSTSSSLFSDPMPTFTQDRNENRMPNGISFAPTASLSSNNGGADFNSLADVALSTNSLTRKPFNDDDDLAAGYNHGPIGTRKSPVWEPLQDSILKSLYGTKSTSIHTHDIGMGNGLNGHNDSDINLMGNSHDIMPQNPNSFFSSNFTQYHRNEFDAAGGGGDGDTNGQRVSSTSPVAPLQRQPSNLELRGLSGLSEIFGGNQRNMGYASNMSAQPAIERRANVWDTPIGMELEREIGACSLLNQQLMFEQQQLQQQQNLLQQQQQQQLQQQQHHQQQQQNAMMSIASLSDLLSSNQFASQASALNNFNHQPQQQQQQQQLHYPNMQSPAVATSSASLFNDHRHLWSSQYNAAGAGLSGGQQTWGQADSQQQQHQQQLQQQQQQLLLQHQQQQQPHQLGAIRPPPGLELQPFPLRLYNQQQQMQQMQPQPQQQRQPQQFIENNLNNLNSLSGIGGLAASSSSIDVNSAMHHPVNNGTHGSNNAFNAYNGLSSLWDMPAVRTGTSHASLHSNQSATSPPPPDLNRSM